MPPKCSESRDFMKNQDTRVQYTKRVLRSSILELLKLKSIDKVTVKEICDTAGLNRGTFYLHYDSPAGLLKDVENQFISDNMKYFDSYWNAQREISFMDQLFECISKNRDICRILMSSNADPQFLRSMTALVRGSTTQEWAKEFPDLDQQHLDFVFEFTIAGSTAIISKWLDGSIDLSAKQLSHRIERLGHHTLMAIREF